MARLLQVASLTGIFDALQSGLEFVAFDGTFAYSNKLLRVERSRAYGSSIGITVEGALDLEEDIAELKGTVVPHTVNRVLGQIPILGPILTGGENEGVFAASYAVNGPLEDPAIAVNPLSALAPGFQESFSMRLVAIRNRRRARPLRNKKTSLSGLTGNDQRVTFAAGR